MAAQSKRIARLPAELRYAILQEVLLSLPSKPGCHERAPLLLCKELYQVLLPQAYTSLHIANSKQLRGLRETLVQHHPGLGVHVKSLVCASADYDSSGYVAGPLLPATELSRAVEQLLLEVPNLVHFAADIFTLSALWEAGQHLESGPSIRSLRTELTFPQYLDIPLYQHLTDLELVCFGLDANIAEDVRTVLPRLKRLTIRLVRRMPATNSCLSRKEDVTDSDDLSASSTLWSGSLPGSHDASQFVKAVQTLRSWPWGNVRCGARLESLTILTWPDAIRELRKHFDGSTMPSPATATKQGFPTSWGQEPQRYGAVQTPHQLNALVSREKLELFLKTRNRSTAEDSAEPPPRPWSPTNLLTVRAGTTESERMTALALTEPYDIADLDDQREALQQRMLLRAHQYRSSPPRLDDAEDDWSSDAEELPPAPLRVDLDPHRKLGPRLGALRAWMEERC